MRLFPQGLGDPDKTASRAAEDIADLKRYKRSRFRDKDALERVIKRNEGLTGMMAKWAACRNRGIERDDLKQAARLGLIIAARKFNPNAGVRFVTYASPWIRTMVQRAVKATKQGMTNTTLLWFEHDPVDSIELPGLVKASGSVEPDFERAIHNESLLKLVDGVIHTPRERDILFNRLMRDKQDQDTLEEIGARWNVSREYIRQLELRVIATCRRVLEPVEEVA